jgi:hypothetical protein
LQPYTSIEPYTKNKPLRNALESAAEEFCRQKRATPNAAQPAKRPDFIFTTDGCSRWPDVSWKSCCVVHDIAYWCGGSEQDRKAADRELMRCVNGKAAIMGTIVYSGVRIGGAPWLPAPWRWGYGWDDWPRHYEPLEGSPKVGELLEKLKLYDVVETHLADTEAR